MQNDKQFAAIQRGIKLAGFWKKTRRRVSQWDAICVHWAKSRGLPGWLGHVPIVLAIVLSITAAILSGLLIGVVIAFVWMAIVGIFSTSNANEDDCSEAKSNGPGYRDGIDGYGYYSGSDDLTSERLD